MLGNISILTDEQIKNLDSSTVTVSEQLDLFPELNYSYNDLPSLDLSSITLGNVDFSTTVSMNNGTFDDFIISGYPHDNSMSVSGNVNIKNGDININGISLSDRLDKMEERLGILRPNPELEEDFEKLKKLGDRYRKLEKKLSEQMKSWNVLKGDSSDV